jgi:hypothetical protein
MVYVHCFLVRGVVMENHFLSLCVVTTGSCCCGSLVTLTETLFSFPFSFFVFWLCASVMSRLAPDILLLQRLGVICIFLILIYSLYRKKIGKNVFIFPHKIALNRTMFWSLLFSDNKHRCSTIYRSTTS